VGAELERLWAGVGQTKLKGKDEQVIERKCHKLHELEKQLKVQTGA
jgi:hypothetical protein